MSSADRAPAARRPKRAVSQAAATPARPAIAAKRPRPAATVLRGSTRQRRQPKRYEQEVSDDDHTAPDIVEAPSAPVASTPAATAVPVASTSCPSKSTCSSRSPTCAKRSRVSSASCSNWLPIQPPAMLPQPRQTHTQPSNPAFGNKQQLPHLLRAGEAMLSDPRST